MLTKEHDRKYFNSLSWVEVPMTKALKMWANSQCHLKCEVRKSLYFYHGQQEMKTLTQDQVREGKWFVEIQ